MLPPCVPPDNPAPFEVGTDRTIQLLQSSWLFAECTDDELRPIADKVESRTAAPGDNSFVTARHPAERRHGRADPA